jgi:hypothetical protein
MQCKTVIAMKAYPVLCNNIRARTDKGMVVLQDSLDSQKDAPGSHSEARASSPIGVQAVNIKVEEFSDVEDREDPVPTRFMEVNFEDEVSCMSVWPSLGISHLHPELPIQYSHMHLLHKT